MHKQTNLSDIHYSIQGEGTPLIFCHAGFVDSGMWELQIEYFSKQYQVISYDMQGYGKSLSATQPISRRHELRTLMDSLNIERAIFVGCSIGGATVLDFALENPNRVLALVLVSTVPGGFEMQGEPPRYMFEMFGALQSGDIDTASELQTRIWFDGMFREPDVVDASLRSMVKKMNRNALDKNGFLIGDSQPLNPLDPSVVKRMTDITRSTLLIAGELDHPEVLRAQTVMENKMPNTSSHIIKGTAHLPNMEQPEEFNQAVNEFLSQLEK